MLQYASLGWGGGKEKRLFQSSKELFLLSSSSLSSSIRTHGDGKNPLSPFPFSSSFGRHINPFPLNLPPKTFGKGSLFWRRRRRRRQGIHQSFFRIVLFLVWVVSCLADSRTLPAHMLHIVGLALPQPKLRRMYIERRGKAARPVAMLENIGTKRFPPPRKTTTTRWTLTSCSITHRLRTLVHGWYVCRRRGEEGKRKGRDNAKSPFLCRSDPSPFLPSYAAPSR